MAKSLVLAEKPSVARDIANVLKCNKKGNGLLEGDKYIGLNATRALTTRFNAQLNCGRAQLYPVNSMGGIC